MLVEEWSVIADHPSYEVSTFGRVINRQTGQEKSPTLNRHNGYLYVNLWTNGQQHMRSVHRLVANAFIPGGDPRLDVNHIDGDKTNSNVVNLEWLTRGDNHRHAYRSGLREPVRSGMRAITCIETGEEFFSISECAQLTGISPSAISNVLAGRRRYVRGYSFTYV